MNTLRAASAFLCCAVGISAAAPSPQTLSVREIAAQLSKATVTIKVVASDGTARTGSGFLTDSSGTVVTNVHVVEGAQKIEVHVSNGDIYEPSGIRVVDARRDIAVLQLAAFNLPTARLGDSDSVAPGDRIVVIGTALGVLENSVTSGVISGIREVEGSRLFQMDAAASPGNSGGPVANDRGEVIGITVAKLKDGQSLNFAVPINYARGELSLPVQQGLTALASSPHTELLSANQTTLPRKWKSLSTASVIDLQISGDVMLAEVELPPQATAAGVDKLWAELKKDGASWVGTYHARLWCNSKVSAFPVRYQRKLCLVNSTNRITMLSPTKIEGEGVNYRGLKFSCEACAYEGQGVPANFTWIPADQ